MKKQKQWFVISKLHRNDLKTMGFKNTNKISDKIMQEIADKIGDSLVWGDEHTTLLFDIAQEDYKLKLK